MASTKECLDFVLEQLSLLDDISYKSMMGEYILMPCLMNCIRQYVVSPDFFAKTWI